MRLTPHLSIIGSSQLGLSGPFDCHVYALRGPDGVVLIDAGSGTHNDCLLSNLLSDLATESIETVIVTHGHFDHCGGVASLRALAKCRVIASQPTARILETGDEEASSLRVAREQGTYPSDFHLKPCKVDHSVGDGEEFVAGGMRFKAIQVRGHSEDSFCYWTNALGENWLFTGDTVFYGAVLGVINVEGSGMSGYRADLGKLAGLAVEGLFPGHGLMTLCGGQKHIDEALRQVQQGFLPRQIGQGDLIF